MYNTHYYANRQRWRDRAIESITAVQALKCLPSRYVADIGTGNGPLFPDLAALNLLPIGIETNRIAAHEAAARHLGFVILVDSSPSLPLADASLGGIIAQHLIEHLPNPSTSLRSWWRALQPGGKLVLLTPNALHPDPTLFDDPDHHHLFTATELQSLLHSIGFIKIHATALFPYLGRHRLGRALSRRFWWLSFLPPLQRSARTLLITSQKPSHS